MAGTIPQRRPIWPAWPTNGAIERSNGYGRGNDLQALRDSCDISHTLALGGVVLQGIGALAEVARRCDAPGGSAW